MAVQALVNGLQRAQPGWYALGMDKRVSLLTRFNEIVKERAAEFASILSTETGKPITQANNEVNATYGRVKHFIQATPLVLAPRTIVPRAPGNKQEERITYEPLGVIANVSAWNYPFFVGTNVFVPALLAGNSVVYKPSEFACRTGEAIGAAMHEAGVPKDVFAVLQGAGAEGKALVTSNGISGVFFTGSVATGKAIAAATLGHGKLIKLQLELGGKDAVYVTDDIKNIDEVAGAVLDGAMYNNGQSCCSVERIYVHKNIYKPFLESITRQAKELKIGSADKKDSYITRLARGKAAVTVLQDQVADAVKKGGRVLCGGKISDSDPRSYLPTIVADAKQDMLVMTEESFGPIVGIASATDDKDAVKLINDSEYGLTASVYTSSNERAERILSQLEVGTVYRNACDSVSVRLPWAGRKNSGIGGTCGEDGIRAFTNTKCWMLRD